MTQRLQRPGLYRFLRAVFQVGVLFLLPVNLVWGKAERLILAETLLETAMLGMLVLLTPILLDMARTVLLLRTHVDRRVQTE